MTDTTGSRRQPRLERRHLLMIAPVFATVLLATAYCLAPTSLWPGAHSEQAVNFLHDLHQDVSSGSKENAVLSEELSGISFLRNVPGAAQDPPVVRLGDRFYRISIYGGDRWKRSEVPSGDPWLRLDRVRNAAGESMPFMRHGYLLLDNGSVSYFRGVRDEPLAYPLLAFAGLTAILAPFLLWPFGKQQPQ